MDGLRVGLAGVGRIGVLHARTLARNAGVGELLIADVDAARARDVAAQVGATAVELDRLFASGLDAVVIAAATAAHADLVRRAAAAKLPVFCEKPLAADIPSTVDVLEQVEAAGVSLTMGFQRRSDPGYRAAREAVRSGRLGRIHSLYSTTYDPAPPPAAYIATSGGIFRDMHIHDFDILRFVTGREVLRVFAAGGNTGEAFFAEAGDVDTAGTVLTFDDGSLAVVAGGRYNGGGYDVRLEVHGSAGTIAVGLDEHVPLVSAEPCVIWPPGKPYPGFFERFAVAYAAELDDFVAFVRGGGDNPSPGREALEALLIAEAADVSLREGRPVGLAEIRSANFSVGSASGGFGPLL
jgi:myo-inositol 2-dehydrogenase/D-chiro-inositol 1-dehydrogenase